MSEKLDLEKYAEQQLLEANLPAKFSYRRAYLLGRQDAFREIEENTKDQNYGAIYNLPNDRAFRLPEGEEYEEKEIKIEPFKTPTSPP